MIKEYRCEYCGMVFENEEECSNHEKDCQGMERKFCMKCGKVHMQDPKKMTTQHFHTIDLGKIEAYGSLLENREVKISICDDCLSDYIHSLEPEYRDAILEDKVATSFNEYYAHMTPESEYEFNL